ncbi:McrB family protein [Avibacterium volantium]|uniref:McrB family protein n=1 Tax=Avibacterium volantium TaxID=762 RepID=UPI003BF82080
MELLFNKDSGTFQLGTNTLTKEKLIDYISSGMLESLILKNSINLLANKGEEEEFDTIGRNILFYGVPGSGKSYFIDKNYGKERIIRVVFHPEYMNSDFIGQLLPTIEKSQDTKIITYEFVPGPFTNIIKQAYENPNHMHYLVIEEINRGNAPSIFGEIFQLLDRNEAGESKYGILNYSMANAIYGNKNHPIKIPSNLTILATMNTSDQNIFTLDTAFQRRWEMRMIINNIDNADHKDMKIADTDITWKIFNKTINELIVNNNTALMSSEDKRLGPYFITMSDLIRKDNIANRFSEKVIKYLWDDVFKFSREKLFDSSFKSLDQVILFFIESIGNNRFNIFNEEVREIMFNNKE